MPELPEVETTCRGLQHVLQGQVVRSVSVTQRRLRVPVPLSFEANIEGQMVLAVRRRAKYVLLDFSNGQTVLIHLGMSGRLVEKSAIEPRQKHEHVVFELANGAQVRFHDARRFGLVTVFPTVGVEHSPFLAHLGPEPLTDAFAFSAFQAALKKRSSPIKAVIMDNAVVVGVGNIYANEALFRAGILPTKPAEKVAAAKAKLLYASIKEVLREAIEAGGTTLRDYVQANGDLGYYHEQFRVYGRAGQPCLVCGTLIQKVVIGQRASFYCSSCQK